MKRVLIVYATRQGQTKKVARRISSHLTARGASVQLVDAKDTSALGKLDLDGFDLLVFGASLHAGGLEPEIVNFINGNVARIERKARSFFLVLLSAATRDPELRASWLDDAGTKVKAQLKTDFGDTEMIAGALKYTQYPLPMKWVMKRIAKTAGESTDTTRDYEYTDWAQVERYAKRMADA